METRDGRSLWERLREHRQAGHLSLHMPGHKENTALAPWLGDLNAGLDITELDGFDDLHAPQGILAEGMERAAALWGSGRTLFQVNGSTGGLLAAVRAATRPGDRILMARNCHKAVYHAAELCGLEPVFLVPPVEETFGLAGSLTPAQVEAALEDAPEVKLLVYPSPTYDGILSDTAGICAVAHARGIPVLVDEAHGAHLGLFSPCPANALANGQKPVGETPGPHLGRSSPFPAGALAQGADLVVTSAHKMLPGLTQTALLHVGRESLVPAEEVARQAGIFQSSSPSYLLMASLDGTVRLLEERGEELFAAWGARLAAFDRAAAALQHLRLVGHGAEAGQTYPGIFALDPAKIVISTRGSALNGGELKGRLLKEHGIELEMALESYATAMTGLGSGDDMPRRLGSALLALDRAAGPAREAPVPVQGTPPLPARQMGLETALRAPAGAVSFRESVGRTSGEYIWAYPPGIPLVIPGEEITETLADTLETLHGAGVKLVGTRGEPPFSVVALQE